MKVEKKYIRSSIADNNAVTAELEAFGWEMVPDDGLGNFVHYSATCPWFITDEYGPMDLVYERALDDKQKVLHGLELDYRSKMWDYQDNRKAKFGFIWKVIALFILMFSYSCFGVYTTENRPELIIGGIVSAILGIAVIAWRISRKSKRRKKADKSFDEAMKIRNKAVAYLEGDMEEYNAADEEESDEDLDEEDEDEEDEDEDEDDYEDEDEEE